MDYRIWISFGLGLFIGANIGALVFGLLVASREDREMRECGDAMTRRRGDAGILERREYGNFN